MKFETLPPNDQYDILCNIANMYYNQGMTKQEIAAAYNTTRFKVAKLILQAREGRIVDIKINYKSMRNKDMETSLLQHFPLKRVVVVNTQYSPYLDGLKQLGQVGAVYLNKSLTPNSVLGLVWGKTMQSVISQLPQIANNPVTSIQLAGRISLTNPSLETDALMRIVSNAYFGPNFFLDGPLYLKQPHIKEMFCLEPTIQATLEKAKEMTVLLTGIGSTTSLPFFKSQFSPYLTEKDKKAAPSCLGSIFGRILDKDGQIADIPLNNKLLAVPLETILAVPRRIAVVCGKHKTKVTARVLRQEYINELITDADTARTLLE